MNLAGLSLRDLEYLVALDHHRHFGRAATACAVSQPTLSAQIRKLEESLDVRIFERGRSVLVTEAGTPIIAQARTVLTEARRLLDMARVGGEPLSGAFRLGVVSTLAPYVAPVILGLLRERYPSLRLVLREGLTTELVRALENGELDALLAAAPLREAELSELPVFWEGFVLAVPREHGLATAPQVRSSDIRAAELILLTEGHCLREQVLAALPDTRSAAGSGQQAAGLETPRGMIGAGMGVSLFPQLAVQLGSLLDDQVAYRLLRDGAPGRHISLFYRSSYTGIRDVRLLRDALRDAMATLGTVAVHGRPGTRALTTYAEAGAPEADHAG